MVSQESEVSNHWKYAFEDDILLGHLALSEYEASIGQNKLPTYQLLEAAGRSFYRARGRLEKESPCDWERAEYLYKLLERLRKSEIHAWNNYPLLFMSQQHSV